MDPVALAMRALLPPVAVALVFLGVAHALRRHGRSAPARLAGPLSLALGFLGAQLALVGRPPLSLDLEFTHSLVPAVLVVGLLGAREAWLGRPLPRARWLLAFALPAYLLDFLWRGTGSPGRSLLVFAGLGTALGLLLASGSALERSRNVPRSAPLAWIGLGGLAAGSLHFSGSSTLGQLEGAWTAALGILGAGPQVARLLTVRGALPEAPKPLGAGSTLLPLALHASLVLGGAFTGELALATALLLALAPLGPWVGSIRVLRRHPGLGTALAWAWALGAAGGALFLTLAARSTDPYAAEYGASRRPLPDERVSASQPRESSGSGPPPHPSQRVFNSPPPESDPLAIILLASQSNADSRGTSRNDSTSIDTWLQGLWARGHGDRERPVLSAKMPSCDRINASSP